MRVAPITAAAFCRSIEIALTVPPDPAASIARIQNSLRRLPEGNLVVSNQKHRVTFYTESEGKLKYLSKQSNHLYGLARRRYQTMLCNILELTDSSRKVDIRRRAKLTEKLQRFICACEKGKLDIARIILTRKQYLWFTGSFRQKPIDPSKALFTAAGLPVRSKSERDILNSCDEYAVPMHYEEQMVIYVKDLVDQLETELRHNGFLRPKTSRIYRNNSARGTRSPDNYSNPNVGHTELFSYTDGSLHWNVPPGLEWMNARGSIWRTYYPPNGTIAIYNDVKGMFADGSIFIWEHEGLIALFSYRNASMERACVMKYKDAVDRDYFIETFERDVDTDEKRDLIIETRILPRLWF